MGTSLKKCGAFNKIKSFGGVHTLHILPNTLEILKTEDVCENLCNHNLHALANAKNRCIKAYNKTERGAMLEYDLIRIVWVSNAKFKIVSSNQFGRLSNRQAEEVS